MNNQIKKTTDYSQFTILNGNRNINQRHLTNLTLSIMNGNLLEANPIIVNENMEIIDGQHRFEVAKNNNLPIFYVVLPNAGMHEVINLNATAKTWTARDYVSSYAVRGNREYQWLLSFVDEYEISLTAAISFLFGPASKKSFGMLKSGKLETSEEQRKVAERRADIFTALRPFISGHGHTPKSFIYAFVKLDEEDNLDVILNNVRRKSATIVPVTSTRESERMLRAFL